MTAPFETITTHDMQIRYQVTPATTKQRGRVMVLPGFTEFIEKHQDQIDRFAAMGLEVLCLDWPSQGLSQRLSPNFPKLVHCDDFSQHLSALDAVMAASGFHDGDQPLLVFGHSMGGAFGAAPRLQQPQGQRPDAMRSDGDAAVKAGRADALSIGCRLFIGAGQEAVVLSAR